MSCGTFSLSHARRFNICHNVPSAGRPCQRCIGTGRAQSCRDTPVCLLPAVSLLMQPSVDVSRIVSQHKKRGRPKLNVWSENVIFSPSSVVTGSDRSVIADPRQFAGHGPTKQLSFLDASPRDTVSNSPTVYRDGAGNLPSEFHSGKLLCH